MSTLHRFHPVAAPNSKRRRTCALLLFAAVLAGCSRPAAPAKGGDGANPAGRPPLRKVSFQLDWYPAPEHGGHFQALVKHYYAEAGLDVTIIPGGPGAYGLLKVAGGAVTFAMGRSDDVMLAVQKGLPLLMVGAQMQHDPQAIMVHEESPVKSFRDLDGKTVMAAPGANYVAFLQARYGIHFSVVPLDYGLARFVADKDFIQQCFISNEPYQVGLQGIKTRALLMADSGFDPYRVIFTNRKFAREHPEAVRAFVAASARGYVEFLRGDSAAARARIAHEDPAESPALMDYSVAAMKRYQLVEGDPAKGERTGLLTAARLQQQVQILMDLKILQRPLPLAQFVSFDFLPPAPSAHQP